MKIKADQRRVDKHSSTSACRKNTVFFDGGYKISEGYAAELVFI